MGSQMSFATGDAGLNWCVTFDRSARELSSQGRSTENTRLTLKSQGSVLRRTSVRRPAERSSPSPPQEWHPLYARPTGVRVPHGMLLSEPYMLGQRTVKLKKELWDRVKRCSDAAGYSGPEEFIEHVLERELAKLEDTQSDEEIVKKLKGLGYLE